MGHGFTFPRRSLLLGALAVSAAPGIARAAPGLVVGAEARAEKSGTLVTIELAGGGEPRAFLLESPNRFVVDVPDTSFAFSTPPAAGGLVGSIRYAARPDGAARLVFDLAQPATLARADIPRGGAKRVLLYTLATVGRDQLAPVAAAPPLVAEKKAGARRVIVIDAGHGGKDPGASGAAAIEKDIVLAAARALRDKLRERDGYEVALTRDGDVFLPLQDRVRFARTRKADLFISIHADAHSDRKASGASVYTLSEKGGDRARALSDSQNWRIETGAQVYSNAVANILLDLAQRETTNRSADFAQMLIGELGQVAPLLRRTHRDAGFFVLLAPDVPAVLLELGFLTNADDERRLADAGKRATMMSAVADAIDVYFQRRPAYAGGG